MPPVVIARHRVLNACALAGWTAVLLGLGTRWLVLALELICVAEIASSANARLGALVHVARLVVLQNMQPPWDHAVLAMWSLTEVARYTMYLAPGKRTRAARYAVPFVTFPLGLAAEVAAMPLPVPLRLVWAAGGFCAYSALCANVLARRR